MVKAHNNEEFKYKLRVYFQDAYSVGEPLVWEYVSKHMISPYVETHHIGDCWFIFCNEIPDNLPDWITLIYPKNDTAAQE